MISLRVSLCSSLVYLTTTIKRSSALMMSTVVTKNSITDRPELKGVVFDMDDTLTIPNLNYAEMYKRCNVPRNEDILHAITKMSPSDAQRAKDIIDEIEEEGRKTLKLAPGALELGKWLRSHNIPIALVTRNTQKTVDVMVNKLWFPNVETKFNPALSRDSIYNLPAKPHPASMFEIQYQWGYLSKEEMDKKMMDASNAQNDKKSKSLVNPELLMIGDSPKHDIRFGKAAGVSTALVDVRQKVANANNIEVAEGADIIVSNLVQLPQKLWNHFQINSPLGHSSPLLKFDKPEPTTGATIAASKGDLASLKQMTIDELCGVDDSNNTPLIWAANCNQYDVVEFLLSNSQCRESKYIDMKGYLGATALCRASRCGYTDILKLLIDVGKADMDLCNDKLQYPLHFAAFKKKTEAVELLLDRGVNTLVFDRKGRTPAEDTKDMNIRKMILDARAKIYGKSLA